MIKKANPEGVDENIIIIGDISETHRRPTFLIGEPLETDMSDRRPIGDRHACSETNMPDRRPTCLIGDPLETDMPDWRPT